MTLLHIETSTNVCSVALSRDGKGIFEIQNNDGLNHAAMLSPFIEQALNKAKEMHLTLNAVCVSSGPGSYTGLRIGVSTAKGLCYGLDVPLIAVSTLEVLCAGALKKHSIPPQALLCPMIDARRMEVYTAFYNTRCEIQREISPEIINENSFNDVLAKQPIYFFGNGSDKCREVLTHPNALFIEHVEPLAENMILLAEKKITEKDFVDIAYFEPFYLKEFQVTTPKR